MKSLRYGAIVAVLFYGPLVRAETISARQLSDLRFASLWPDLSPKQTPHPAVVRVKATDRDGFSLGSGTLVDVNDDYGLVVTNWHVVRDAVGPIEVVFPDGFHSPARVVRTDREWDLASLLIWKPAVQPVPLSTQAPRPGEKLSIAGYGSGNYKMQSGACTQYLAPAPGKPLEIVELSAAARHGDSGGPILNNRGELAGVLFGEGGGRTDGSYGGRVHQFLQLTAKDLQALPATNTAKSKPADDNYRVASLNGAGAARSAARFDGGVISEGENAPPPVSTSPSDYIALRPAESAGTFDASAVARPLAINSRGDRNSAAENSTRESTGRPLGHLQRFWLAWGGEVQSFLAAFGVAAILLQLFKRNR